MARPLKPIGRIRDGQRIQDIAYKIAPWLADKPTTSAAPSFSACTGSDHWGWDPLSGEYYAANSKVTKYFINESGSTKCFAQEFQVPEDMVVDAIAVWVAKPVGNDMVRASPGGVGIRVGIRCLAYSGPEQAWTYVWSTEMNTSTEGAKGIEKALVWPARLKTGFTYAIIWSAVDDYGYVLWGMKSPPSPPWSGATTRYTSDTGGETRALSAWQYTGSWAQISGFPFPFCLRRIG